MRPPSLSPFALYAGRPILTTSIAAAVGSSSAAEANSEPAAAEITGAASTGNHEGTEPHGGGRGPAGGFSAASAAGFSCCAAAAAPRPERGLSQPEQLSAYAMALYQELQAVEPNSPDVTVSAARRSAAAAPTRGSAEPPAAPAAAAAGLLASSQRAAAAAAPAPLTEVTSLQSSTALFNSREYGLYGLYEQNGTQEQLITGYYTSLPSISPRSFRNAPLSPSPRNWQRINTASSTYVQLRNRFLRNVFGLLALSLGAAAAAGAAALAAPPSLVHRLLLSQPWVLHLTAVLSLGTLLLLALSERLRRPHPHSLLAFGAFSVGLVLLVASATAALSTCLLVQAVGLAALALACVAACAQLLGRLADLTAGAAIAWACAGVVLGWAGGAALEAVAVGSAAAAAGGGGGLGRCSWVGHAAGGAAAAAAAFSMYAVVDVLALLYGRHAYAVHVDEHVFAALGVYLDPLNMALFGLHKLQMVMMRRGRAARGAGSTASESGGSEVG
ncbi:hypothetical protein PLESTF_000270600 [Pleodorina starrii]|nr:hypothetical protein PLESTM_001222800 [Pleodorina starrii]GLC65269.1 hypothetical protein PLESTF_000270600 [Pleodorina starrii]